MNIDNEKYKIKSKIRRLDEQIAFLQKLKAQHLARIHALNSEQEMSSPLPSHHNQAQDNILLFKQYFRGQENVYARLWFNQRSHKKGYSPACKNEWIRTLCKKPVVKCSECSHQAFLPLDEKAVKRHIEGKDVIGVYPMTDDEKCFFLAFDFDKECWFDDINALRETCKDEGINIGIERSRSGKGGHAWIFFEEAIPALLARQLGTSLITRTMSTRFEIDMKSYDRLFPNQNTLPKGGFGNLIALPFQKAAVACGNSVFINKKGIPYQDQWTYLSSIEKISFARVREIVDQALVNCSIMDVRFSSTEEDTEEPWLRLPSGKKRFKTKINNLPKRIKAILSNRIFIKTDQAPAVLLNKLKHLAAFQNPEFYKKQKMRFSTYDTPRVICCAELDNGYMSLPRGCLDDMKALLNEYNVDLSIEDKRNSGQPVDYDFQGVLNEEQLLALNDVLSNDCGVFVAPPGSGKTILAIAAIAQRKTNTLILVHRKPLMEQWQLQMSSFLGVDLKQIGQIGGGKNKRTGLIDIAMVQSMDRKDGVDDHMEEYGFVIVDECHHVSAFSFEKVLTQAKAKYVLGLTATPYRRDGHQPIIYMQCGSICHRIKQKDALSHITHSRVIPRITDFDYDWNEDTKINNVWVQLVANEARNQLILRDINDSLDDGRFPLVLTERREHLEYLADRLENRVDLL
ncbi:MAG: DEAD/DEAH box helicase family protein, partial [Candidatus Scalindua sp.]